MQESEIRCVAVIGAGLMGHGIAQDFATHGYEVHLYARSQERLDQALQNIQSGLELAQRLGHLTPEQAAPALPRIRTGTVLEEQVVDADLVIEAVSENLPLKQQLFRTLDSVCPRHTILASTTSTRTIARRLILTRDHEQSQLLAAPLFYLHTIRQYCVKDGWAELGGDG